MSLRLFGKSTTALWRSRGGRRRGLQGAPGSAGKSDGILNLLLQELEILPRAPVAAGSEQLQRELATTWPKGSR